ncbi:hypothetical protein B5S30_g3102 [[Candida] boidinii]|nr:hypothetical protein B5S30_g3102 [[Candida] boidinii]GMF99410.1 unnamed protein product [[Candida] boidinii]
MPLPSRRFSKTKKTDEDDERTISLKLDVIPSEEALERATSSKFANVLDPNELEAVAKTTSYLPAQNSPFEVEPNDNAGNSSDEEAVRPKLSNIFSSGTIRTTRAFNFDEEDPITYPEGGKEANLVVLGAFLALLPSWGIANSTGVIQTYIAENQLSDVPTSTISWIFSIYLFLMLGSCVVSGTYFDRNGARLPLVLGSIMLVGGILGMGNSTKVYQFILSFSVLCGFGSGILMSPVIGAISHYFKKNRATANGIATNGGSVGGVIFPLMLRKLYTQVGFMWSMRILALLCGVCLALSFFLVKERKFENVAYKELNTRKETIRYYLLESFDFKSLRKDIIFVFVCIGCIFAELNIVISCTYFSFVCIKTGFTQDEAFLFVTVMNAVAIVGRTLISYIADKWTGRFNILLVALLLMAVFELVIWLPFKRYTAAVYVFCCFYGFFYGAGLSLLPTICGQVSKTSEFGRRYSTMYAIVGVSILCLLPASAAILGDGLDESRIVGFIIFSALMSIVSMFAYFIARYLCMGYSLEKF